MAAGSEGFVGFATWNERLFSAFFGEFSASQPVRLGISRELLDSEFIDVGGAAEFERIVTKGPDWPVTFINQFFDWVDRRTLLDRALGLYRQWNHSYRRHPSYVQPRHDSPPYLPYLCLLSYAWTIEVEGVAGHNFYDRLEQVYPNHGLRGHLSDLNPLWEGLEQWCLEQRWRFGMFRVEQLGGMAWVGIPKAQVIFTGRRLESLPTLFGQLGLTPESQVSQARLRTLIREHEQLSRHCLGANVVGAIFAEDGIGNAAIAQLLEYLTLWDGQVPEADDDPERYHATTSGKSSPCGRLLIAIRPDQDNEGWTGEVHFAADDMPNGLLRLEYAKRYWTGTVVDGIGGPFRDESVRQLLPLGDLLAVGAGMSIDVSMNWSDEVDGEAEVRATWRHRRVLVLQWQGGILIEQSRLPSEGDVYLLLNDSGWVAVRDWASRIDVKRRPQIMLALPQAGLPSGWRVVHLPGLGSLRDDEWSAFPQTGEEIRRRRSQVLFLRGGTRARRTGIRRVYAAYDLPKVILEGDSSVEVHASGAKVEDITEASSLPSWFPKGLSTSGRVYRLMPVKECSVVSIAAVRQRTEIGRIAFGVARSADNAEPVTNGAFSLNRMGDPRPDTTGAHGPVAPANEQAWSYIDGPFSEWDQLQGEPELDQPCHIFLDWLATHGQVSFPRVRDFAAEQLAARGLWNAPNREARALSLLGHLEIRTDARGRWTTIHSVPPVLYPLPTTRRGCHQAVLGGTYTRKQAESLVRAANELGLPVEVRPQCVRSTSKLHLSPPRLCLLSDDVDDLCLAADAAGISCIASPPAWAYACWSGSLTDWVQSIATFPESGPGAMATYRPCEFRTRDGDEWPGWGASKLARCEDQVTRRHFQYVLVTRDSGNLRHAFVTQRAWATWYVHRDVMLGLLTFLKREGDFKVPIAYTDETRAVVVPLELELPLVLARALTLCSGLAPELLTPEQYGAYADAANGFTPGPAYQGYCWAYPNIPKRIADTVVGKLGAVPQLYPPLPSLEFQSA